MTIEVDARRARNRRRDGPVPAAGTSALLIVAIAVLLAPVVLFELPKGVRYFFVLQKLAHSVTFALVALLVAQALRHRKLRYPFIKAFAIAVGLGALTEVGQIFTHRDPAALDVVRDAVGAAAALGVQAWWTDRSRRTALFGGLVAGAVVLVPVVWCALAYANRASAVPAIVGGGTPLDFYFIRGNEARVSAIDVPAEWSHTANERAVLVSNAGRQWSGLHVLEPWPDWSSRRDLIADVVNPNARPLRLTIRVHDAEHDQSYQDRFNREFVVAPNSRAQIRFPIAEIERAPRTRALDLRRVRDVSIFNPVAGGAPEWLLVGLRLE